jgi:hypothetical protein
VLLAYTFKVAAIFPATLFFKTMTGTKTLGFLRWERWQGVMPNCV